MGLALVALTLLTGSYKAVSVCGVNSGLVARRSAGATPQSIAVYMLGLLLGALLLTLTVAALGRSTAEFLNVPLGIRQFAVTGLLLTIGAFEVLHGAWLLPHIGWAVPRTWATTLRNGPFLFVFGLIRGWAVFNHSPFASMHAWLLAIFLLPEQIVAPIVAIILASGLALWTLAFGVASLVQPSRTESVVHAMSQRLLTATGRMGRLDGVGLCVIGGWLLL